MVIEEACFKMCIKMPHFLDGTFTCFLQLSHVVINWQKQQPRVRVNAVGCRTGLMARDLNFVGQVFNL